MKRLFLTQSLSHFFCAAWFFGICLLTSAAVGAAEKSDPTIDLYNDSSQLQTMDSLPAGPNPTASLFKSLAVPGWGQLSNHRNLKAGFVVALEGALIYRWLDLRGETADLRAKYESLPLNSSERSAAVDHFVATRYDRNLFGWFTGATIFLSMFDAYVDAHLSRFPSRKKELSITPTTISIAPQIRTDAPSESVLGVRLKLTF